MAQVQLDKVLVKEFFEVMTTTSTDFTDAFVALTEYVEQLANLANTTSSNNNTTSNTAAEAELVDKLTSRAASPTNMLDALRRKMQIHKLSMHPQQIMQLSGILNDTRVKPAQLSAMFNGASVDVIREEISSEKRKLDMLVTASEGIKKYDDKNMTKEIKAEEDRKLWAGWCAKYAQRITQRVDSGTTTPSKSLQQQQLQLSAQQMRTSNPTFILRSWLAQDAIQLTEKQFKENSSGQSGADAPDYSGVRTLLEMLQQPFNPEYSTFRNNNSGATTCGLGKNEAETTASLKLKYTSTPPDWAEGLICTCSS